jgi:outer membrane protein OmpA-like peptidoglycan-associated protein
MSVRTTASSKASAPISGAPVRLLQRACACGGHAGVDGECAECRQKRLQRKLAIGADNDRYEREAEAVARALTNGSWLPIRAVEPATLQRAPESHAMGAAPPVVEQALRRPGRALEAKTREWAEGRLGYDFGQVRVHTGPLAERSARSVGALAYTVGNHVVFGVGQYRPEAAGGRRLLAHELVHTVQQGAAVRHLQRACDKAVPVAKDCVSVGGATIFDVAHTSEGLFLFGTGCDDLLAEYVPALKLYARRIRPSQMLHIHGFASEEGSGDFNQRLSCARAHAIRRLLVERGVDPAQISTLFAHGATRGPRPEHRSALVVVAGTQLVDTDDASVPVATPEQTDWSKLPEREQVKEEKKKKKKKPGEDVDDYWRRIWDLLRRLPRGCKICPDLRRLLRRSRRLLDILEWLLPRGILRFDPDAGMLLLASGLGVLAIGALLASPYLFAQLGLGLNVGRILALADTLLELQETLREIDRIVDQVTGGEDSAPDRPRRSGRPDVDVDMEPEGETNEFGCLVKPIAQQFGRYPCHADFATHLSGTRREYCITTPHGFSKDLDALDHGGKLYEVKTGYRWLVFGPNEQMRRTRLDAFIEQSEDQLLVADQCGFDLVWYVNDSAVKMLLDRVLRVPVVYQKFPCNVDSDDERQEDRCA